ncbi:MAG: hypothetical protein WBY94_26385 [Polyangiaceae bacterium]
MGTRWLSRMGVAFTLGGMALAQACQSNGPAVDTAGNGRVMVPGSAGGACAPGRAGCACDGDGLVAPCGKVADRHGDYVTCAMGQAVCKGGQWGACITDTLVSRSIAGAPASASSLHALSTTIACPSTSPQCADPCDPNPFTLTTSGAGDIDASGTALEDGGLTLASTCHGMSCQVASGCPSGSPTTLTGAVYDPAGAHPVYDALVYVPADPSGSLPLFSPGSSCDSCAAASAIDAVALARTAADGSFVLPNVPATDVAPGNPIPLVVQMGKWRREVMLSSVPKCTTVAVDPSNSRLPRNQFDGHGGKADIPRMAIATGGQDPVQCLLLKMGLDPAEFQIPGGNRRIDYYVDSDGAGMDFSPAMAAPPKSALVGSLATLLNYDLVILPCAGKPPNDPTGTYPADDDFADNVSAYANAGGRIFTTHFGFTWLATPANATVGGAQGLVASSTNPATGRPNPFFGVANWNLDSHAYGSATADIDMALPGNQAFSTWLENVGASTTPGELTLTLARHDVDSVKPPAQEWIHDDSAPGEPFYFSFDTPLATGDAGVQACGRVGFADFHVSTAALADPSGTCATDSDCGFTATCSNPGAMGTCAPAPCATSDDCRESGSTCVGAAPSTCSAQPCKSDSDCDSNICNGGACACTGDDPQQCSSGVCTGGACVPSSEACARDEQCGSTEACAGGAAGTCMKTCATDGDCRGEFCVGGSCQGCRAETDCPSRACKGGAPSTCSASSNLFPLACAQSILSPQEAALEFLLLDLTSCGSRSVNPIASPVAAPTVYEPATFTEDFGSTCPAGTRPIWRELDWQASIPDTASVVFAAQSADPSADGGPPDYGSTMPVELATATTSTALPGFDVALVDTGTTGAFNLAIPAVVSRSNLRLTVTMNPTSDSARAPTLIQWQVKADCLAAE